MNINKKDKIHSVCTPMNIYGLYGIKGLLGIGTKYNRTLYHNSYLRHFGSVDNPLITFTQNYSKLDLNFDKKDENFNPELFHKNKIEYKSVETQTEYKYSSIDCNMNDREWVFIKDE